MSRKIVYTIVIIICVGIFTYMLKYHDLRKGNMIEIESIPKVSYEYIESVKLENVDLDKIEIIASEYEGGYRSIGFYSYPKTYYFNKDYMDKLLGTMIVKKDFEDYYKCKLDFDTQSSDDSYLIIAFGSRIQNIEVYKKHEDELSEFKDTCYDTYVTYEEEYKANMVYFYKIDRKDLLLISEKK